MSLMDTIKGARREAEATGIPFERKKGDVEGDDSQGVQGNRGATRKSAARAKPSREAAAGVRVVNRSGGGKTKSKKPAKEMTKEERKAERKAERELEDRRYSLTQAYINENEEYQRARKNWWKFLGAGVGLAVVAFVIYGIVSRQGEGASTVLAIISGATIVLSYIAIIGALVYDWVKIRPLRKQAEERVASMSDKRVRTVLDQKAREQAKEEKRVKRTKRKKR